MRLATDEGRGTKRLAAVLRSLACMLAIALAVVLQLATTAEAKAVLKGPSRMPVGSTASFLSPSSDHVTIESENVSIAGNVEEGIVRANRPGTTTLYLVDDEGHRLASKKVTVYDLKGKSWELQSVADSRYVLDIQGKSKKNSARMIVYKRNNGKNQRFRFEAKDTLPFYGDTLYAIKCVHSGKYLDVKGGSSKKSQPVIQYSYNGGANQLWTLWVNPDNSVSFQNSNSWMDLDVQGGRAKNSARIIQYPSNNGKNQRWVLNQK